MNFVSEVKEAIHDFKVVKKFDICSYIDKIICLSIQTQWILARQTIKGTIVSEKCVDNVKGLSYSKTHIHHSHITRDIIDYAHSYCNFKWEKIKKK